MPDFDRIDEAQIVVMERLWKFYPNLDIEQLGLFIAKLGYLKATYGHASALGVLRDYTDIPADPSAPPYIKEIYEFIEREIFGLTKGRMDIDTYKMGKKSTARSNSKYTEET